MEVNQISGFHSFIESFDFSSLLNILLTLFASLLCITLHELSHGYVAYMLGDNTAKNAGRLSFNPLRHIDVTGFIMMLVLQVGWAKPVPVDYFNLRKPKRDMALVALAGPLSNVIITVVFLFLYGALYIPFAGTAFGGMFLSLAQRVAYISLGFAVFNLLPFPPLDGAKILFSFLRDEHYEMLMKYEGYGSLILFVLMLTGSFSYPVAVVRQLIYNEFAVVAQFACDLIAIMFYI